MDTVNMKNNIEAQLVNNAGRANNMSTQIQEITDEYLEICIDDKLLHIAIPHDFYPSCSSDGVITSISSTECECHGAASEINDEEEEEEVLGLVAQVLQELVRMPVELVDLEISLALAATYGSRDVFEPFPPFLLQKREISQRSEVLNGNHIENPRNKNKNMGALTSIIRSFPSVLEMKLCSDEAELKAKLAKSWMSTAQSVRKLGGDFFVGKEAWQLPYNVLGFILSTNRLSLVYLSEDDDKIIKFYDNSSSPLYQFAVVQDSPEMEVGYTSKNKHDEVSRFGFHGSPKQNWYSILRNGLRCLSDTKLMSSGNAMGDGIYLADSFGYSAEYARRSRCNDGWRNGMYKDGNFYVVGICQVISSSSIKEESGICAVPKEFEEMWR